MGRPAKTIQPAYGKHLASLRKAAALSQQQVADQMGVRQSTVASWERSKNPPRGEFIVPLAGVLGVSLETLLGTPEPNRPGPPSKLDQLIEQINELPRRRQQRVAGLLERIVDQEMAEAGVG